MRAVDTDVLVRLITRDDPRQTAAAESFVANGAWASTLAVAEAMWVLGSVYELSSRDQARAIEMLLDYRELVLQDREIVTAACSYFEEDRHWAFPIA